jgi:hypothetical protein
MLPDLVSAREPAVARFSPVHAPSGRIVNTLPSMLVSRLATEARW